MPTSKTSYLLQVVVILSVFFFVLFNLVFRLIVDMRSESEKKRVVLEEKEKVRQSFIVNIDEKYNHLMTFSYSFA